MKIASIAVLSLTLLGMGESKRLGEPEENRLLLDTYDWEEIMRSGNPFTPKAQRLYPGLTQAKVVDGGNGVQCRLRLNNGGNLMVEKNDGSGFRTTWQTGNPSGGGDFFMALQIDGNIVVYRENGPGGADNEVVYAAGSGAGIGPEYKLYLEDWSCELKLTSGPPEKIQWQNINDGLLVENAGPLHTILKKGNIYRPGDYHTSLDDDHFMYLQNDCNLVIYEGNDLSDIGAAKWASNTRDPNLENCHLSVENRLTLYGDNGVLWSGDAGWPDNYAVCLSENGPYPCDRSGFPICDLSPAEPFNLEGSVNIGNPPTEGSSERFDPWSYTVRGSGRVGCDEGDTGACPDALHFAYKTVTGNFEMQALVCEQPRLLFEEPASLVGRSGIMAREGLEPGAKHIFNGYTANSIYYRPSTRTQTNGPVTLANRDVADVYCWWMKLKRDGNDFTAKYAEAHYPGSGDDHCVPRPEDEYGWHTLTETISMNDPIYVGLAVTSYNDDAYDDDPANDGLEEAMFRYIQLN